MDISELELVQIVLILLAMSATVLVVVCLLLHYRLVALTLLGRLGHVRPDPAAPRNASGRPNGVLTQQAQGRPIRGLHSRAPPVLVQCRLQPTYPYLPQETLNLPPTVWFPNGEGKAPRTGPRRCSPRHPELKRACVRAPPNRTLAADNYTHGAGRRSESPPPSYSVTIEDTGCKSAPPAPKRLQTCWSPAENRTSTEAVPHNSSVT
ncbi:protein TMEPAI-like isoform X2 [Syngnathoides biaculeatus]|uniref:protein TMEPAI-like isoform X2 n=1 Tax=Syngnathoides biaculeatus TaxID=300417 RepID=UPI002ADE7267|nr:protein TMEPAI-like isoform X2 [Syngnathoides biaculeatus]